MLCCRDYDNVACLLHLQLIALDDYADHGGKGVDRYCVRIAALWFRAVGAMVHRKYFEGASKASELHTIQPQAAYDSTTRDTDDRGWTTMPFGYERQTSDQRAKQSPCQLLLLRA